MTAVTALAAGRPAWLVSDPAEMDAYMAAELAELRADYPGWVIEDRGRAGLAAWPRRDPAATARTAPGTAVMRGILATAAAVAAATAAPVLAAAPVGTVYLLHFSRPFRHARHYTGWTACLERRVALHRSGRSGVPLVRAAVAAGITLELARTWPGETRAKERRLKTSGGAGRYCPLCRAVSLAWAGSRTAPALAGAAL